MVDGYLNVSKKLIDEIHNYKVLGFFIRQNSVNCYL